MADDSNESQVGSCRDGSERHSERHRQKENQTKKQNEINESEPCMRARERTRLCVR